MKIVEAVAQTSGVGAKQQRAGEPPESDASGALLTASEGSPRLICLDTHPWSWRSITNNFRSVTFVQQPPSGARARIRARLGCCSACGKRASRRRRPTRYSSCSDAAAPPRVLDLDRTGSLRLAAGSATNQKYVSTRSTICGFFAPAGLPQGSSCQRDDARGRGGDHRSFFFLKQSDKYSLATLRGRPSGGSPTS